MREPLLDFINRELGDSFLLITTGLPATWKTETAEEIVRVKECLMLRSDILRLDVLKGQDIFDSRVADNMSKRLSVYDELFRQADEKLAAHDCLILDATFITQELRQRAAEIAARRKKTLVILETRCPKEVSLARISRRSREKYESNAITEEAYLNNVSRFQPVDVKDIKQAYPDLSVLHLTVDTSRGEQNEIYVLGVERA